MWGSRFRALITAVMLAGIPLYAVASHWSLSPNDRHFVVPSEVIASPDSKRFFMMTPLNTLDVTELSGDNQFRPDDTVYVHLFPSSDYDIDALVYPFAVTRKSPALSENDLSLVLQGVVKSVDETVISVAYNFERIRPPVNFHHAYLDNPNTPTAVEIAVTRQGAARITAIMHQGDRHDYREIEKPELFARIQNGARIAPAR